MKKIFRNSEAPMLKTIQPLYEDVYINWTSPDGSKFEKGEIIPFKEAKIQYGDELVHGYTDKADALVTVVCLIRKEWS